MAGDPIPDPVGTTSSSGAATVETGDYAAIIGDGGNLWDSLIPEPVVDVLPVVPDPVTPEPTVPEEPVEEPEVDPTPDVVEEPEPTPTPTPEVVEEDIEK